MLQAHAAPPFCCCTLVPGLMPPTCCASCCRTWRGKRICGWKFSWLACLPPARPAVCTVRARACMYLPACSGWREHARAPLQLRFQPTSGRPCATGPRSAALLTWAAGSRHCYCSGRQAGPTDAAVAVYAPALPLDPEQEGFSKGKGSGRGRHRRVPAAAHDDTQQQLVNPALAGGWLLGRRLRAGELRGRRVGSAALQTAPRSGAPDLLGLLRCCANSCSAVMPSEEACLSSKAAWHL